ncbi:hypothetical protein ACFQ9X_10460 [Catenulispora yoronensis]
MRPQQPNPASQAAPGPTAANQHPGQHPGQHPNQHPSFQPRPESAQPASPPLPVRQPAPQGGARPPQHTGFSAGLAAPAGPRPGRPLPPDGAPSLPSVFGPTSDLRPEPNPGAKPARRKPEWILSADLRVSGQPPATTPSAGRDLARRPGSETAIMPADGSGDDLPPSLRAGNGGRTGDRAVPPCCGPRCRWSPCWRPAAERWAWCTPPGPGRRSRRPWTRRRARPTRR